MNWKLHSEKGNGVKMSSATKRQSFNFSKLINRFCVSLDKTEHILLWLWGLGLVLVSVTILYYKRVKLLQ